MIIYLCYGFIIHKSSHLVKKRYDKIYYLRFLKICRLAQMDGRLSDPMSRLPLGVMGMLRGSLSHCWLGTDGESPITLGKGGYKLYAGISVRIQ